MVLHGKKWVAIGVPVKKVATQAGIRRLHDEPVANKKRNECEIYARLRERVCSDPKKIKIDKKYIWRIRQGTPMTF